MSIIAHVYNPSDTELKNPIDTLSFDEIPLTGNYIKLKKDNNYINCVVKNTAFPDTTNNGNEFLFIQKIKEYRMEPPELEYIIVGHGLPKSSIAHQINVLDLTRNVLINGSPISNYDSVIINKEFYKFNAITSNHDIGIFATIFVRPQTKENFMLNEFLV